MATTIFDQAHPNVFQSTFNSMNLYQHEKNQAFSSSCSRDIVDLKNLEMWLADNILVHISGTRYFPSMGFVEEYSKWYKCSL